MRLSNTPVEERCELLFCVPGIMLDWCGAKLIALFPGSPCNPLLSGRAWKWDYQIDIFHDWDLSCDLSSYQGIRGIGWSLQARWDLDRTHHSSGRVCTLVVIVTHDWGNSFTPPPPPPMAKRIRALYAYYWLFIVWSHGCTCSCEHACLLSPLSPSSTSPPLLLSLSPPPSPSFPLLSLSSSHVPSPSHLFPSSYSLPPSSLVTPCGLMSIPAVWKSTYIHVYIVVILFTHFSPLSMHAWYIYKLQCIHIVNTRLHT